VSSEAGVDRSLNPRRSSTGTGSAHCIGLENGRLGSPHLDRPDLADTNGLPDSIPLETAIASRKPRTWGPLKV